MLRLQGRRRMLAFTLIEVMAVSGIMSTLASQGGSYRYAVNEANAIKGISNLKQIHTLLMAQCISGELPKAAFYPKGDPKSAPDSIMSLIEGAPRELFVSPFAPEELKQKGLTFVWNDTVNGKDLSILPKETWLLIDLAAFIANPAVAKPERYLILYADGRAAAARELPDDIVKVVKEAEARLKAKERKAGPQK